MLYGLTKDLLYVKDFLGHKNIKKTLRYFHLEEALFRHGPDEFICETAKTMKEAKELIEHGFEYVTEMQEVELFERK